MSLTSPLFIFLCLPIMMAIYSFVPRSAKRQAISVFSIIFYIIANIRNPFALVILVLTVVLVYFAARAVDRSAGHKRMMLGIFFVSALLLIFLTLRFADALGINFFGIRYPFGASVFMLCAISFIVDVKRGDAPPPSLVDAVFYITYFPVMAVGPVIKYKDSKEIFAESDFSFANLAAGAEYFMLGFIKRFAIASVLFDMLGIMHSNLSAGIGLLSVIEYVFILPILAYSFFSGYSDMAIGITKMLGFSIPCDFGAFFASSPIKYCRGFMSSLHSYFEDYLGRLWRRDRTHEPSGFLTKFSIFTALVFWFDSELTTLPLLIFLAALLALFAGRAARAPKSIAVRCIGYAGTLLAVSVFWSLIIAKNSPELFGFAAEFALNLGGFKSLLVFGGVSLAKYVITIFTVLLVFCFLDRGIKSPKSGNLRIAVNCCLFLLFTFTLFFWFPQYPDSGAVFMILSQV